MERILDMPQDDTVEAALAKPYKDNGAGKGDDARPANMKVMHKNRAAIRFPRIGPKGFKCTGINRARKVY